MHYYGLYSNASRQRRVSGGRHKTSACPAEHADTPPARDHPALGEACRAGSIPPRIPCPFARSGTDDFSAEPVGGSMAPDRRRSGDNHQNSYALNHVDLTPSVRHNPLLEHLYTESNFLLLGRMSRDAFLPCLMHMVLHPASAPAGLESWSAIRLRRNTHDIRELIYGCLDFR